MKTYVPFSGLAIVGMAALFTMSDSWAIGLAAKPFMANQNQSVIVDVTVPVRLSALDRRIHSGKVTCTVIQKESSDNMFGLGGLGSGNAIFSINSSDGSFNGNVKVSVVPGKSIQDSQFAGGLKYACWLYLSPDGNTWEKPNAGSKDDMFKPKPATGVQVEVTGNISAP